MNMKIKPEHYEQLETAVREVLENNPDFNTIHASKSPMTRRWLLWNKVCDLDNYRLAFELYPYLDDSNIDTALRKITGII